MVSLRHLSRYSSQVIHLFTSLSLFNSINSSTLAVISFSFPDVKGALPPTVTTAFINAVSTLWQVKKTTLTHKTFAINNRCRAGFLPFYVISKARRVKPAAIFLRLTEYQVTKKMLFNRTFWGITRKVCAHSKGFACRNHSAKTQQKTSFSIGYFEV